MNRTYQQLTQVERYQIQALHEQGFSSRQIANRIGRHHSSVCRELKRYQNTEPYCADIAQQQTDTRRSEATKASKRTAKVERAIEHALLMQWSPQQLAERMLIEWPSGHVSTQTIYRRIEENRMTGGAWYQRLPRFGKTRWRGGKRRSGKSNIPNRVGIEERPDTVNKRARLGDWEGDTVKGKKSHLVTLVDRKSRLLLAGLVTDLRKETVSKRIETMMNAIEHRQTLTLDNGGEFAGHESVAEATGMVVYFADPYASHQRGSNENSNGLLRRCWPKGTDFSTVTEGELQHQCMIINMKPRPVLGGLSALEVYKGARVALIP